MKEIKESSTETSSGSLRLTARIVGTLWILICLTLFIGYYLEGSNRNSGSVSITPDIFGIAILFCMAVALVGLIIAWWYEGSGGLISFIGFFLAGILLIIDPKLNFSPIFCIVFVPSILYLAYWKETKK